MVNKNKQIGFTLIEVLIAFIILSVGLLAIVSLQATSKQNTHQAMQRSLAVSYAESIIERIRANPTAVTDYVAVGTIGSAEGGIYTQEQPISCTNNACSPLELAENDMLVLQNKLVGTASTISENNVISNTTGLISPLLCMTFQPRTNPALQNTGFLTVRIQWQGLASISDPVTDASDVCNGGENAGEDPFIRQIVLNTYVIDETEL